MRHAHGYDFSSIRGWISAHKRSNHVRDACARGLSVGAVVKFLHCLFIDLPGPKALSSQPCGIHPDWQHFFRSFVVLADGNEDVVSKSQLWPGPLGTHHNATETILSPAVDDISPLWIESIRCGTVAQVRRERAQRETLFERLRHSLQLDLGVALGSVAAPRLR